MSKGPWHIKPTELKRTIKTIQEAGLSIANVDVDFENRRVLLGIGGDTSDASKTHKESDAENLEDLL